MSALIPGDPQMSPFLKGFLEQKFMDQNQVSMASNLFLKGTPNLDSYSLYIYISFVNLLIWSNVEPTNLDIFMLLLSNVAPSPAPPPRPPQIGWPVYCFIGAEAESPGDIRHSPLSAPALYRVSRTHQTHSKEEEKTIMSKMIITIGALVH